MTEKKILKATHVGMLQLGNIKISCAVLEDGRRVLVERSLATAIGRKGGGEFWKNKKTGKKLAPFLPEYISAKYLNPYISSSLKEKLLAPITYTNKNGKEMISIEAILLPEICDVWLKARDAGVLKGKQIETAKSTDILIRSLAKIGITALVDEATGYIDDKKKNEYIELFKEFIRETARDHKKEFPEPFYDMIYRLYGKVRISKKNHPRYFSKFTRKYIYEPLANSNGLILEMLDDKNPMVVSKSGNKYRKYKLFQFLEDNLGMNVFRGHIWRIIGMGDDCKNHKQFERKFVRTFQVKNQQLEMFEETLEK